MESGSYTRTRTAGCQTRVRQNTPRERCNRTRKDVMFLVVATGSGEPTITDPPIIPISTPAYRLPPRWTPQRPSGSTLPQQVHHLCCQHLLHLSRLFRGLPPPFRISLTTSRVDVHRPHPHLRSSWRAGSSRGTCASCRCAGAKLAPEKSHRSVRSVGQTLVPVPRPRQRAGRSPHRPKEVVRHPHRPREAVCRRHLLQTAQKTRQASTPISPHLSYELVMCVVKPI